MSIVRRPRARADLIDLADYLDQVRPSLGDQFLDAAERTFALLERLPGIGAPFPLSNPQLQGLRHYPVQGFPNHIIFYLPTSDGIEVVRVLHGARDLTGVLEGSA
jgi:toxin ParE1/3/4